MVKTLLNERYRIDSELGQGGMGIVYRAHDTLLARDVAVKVLSKAGLGTEGRVRLLHEARATAQLNHPNIVQVYDAGEDAPSQALGESSVERSGQVVSFIVMELVEHQTLFEREIDSLDEIIFIARQICDALEHAHAQGIVHRDLKPENVIVSDSNQVKLTDFGLARSVASRISVEGAVVGTVFYLPPEQALGKEIDGRADLYALGVMLYELTTGRLPFKADDPLAVITQHIHAPVVPPRTYNAEIPPALEALILKLLSKQPEDRPASAADVRQALEALVTASAVPAAHPRLSPLDQLACGRLVGREREFAQAKTLWKQAAATAAATAAASAGERNVLLISGEPGVGKTPLVREIRALAEVSGGLALGGECYSEGSALYMPIAQIIREALPLLEHTLPDLVLADLITLAPDLQARYPDVPPNSPLDPQTEQQRLFESVVALCAALAERAPLLLTVEDVQWADSGTLFFLRHLARRGRSSKLRLLIVLTYREAELDQGCCLNDVLLDLNRERLAERIKLARLSRQQTGDLLSVMLQDEVSPEFLDGMYRETEGNPFFIEEVCKALIEEGKLYRDNGHWHKLDMSGVRLPQSVRMAIQARIGRLPNQTQDALRLAAIIGREFDFATLRQAGELDEETLIDALEAAERAQLIVELESEKQDVFAFAHGLTMTTLRESVSGLRRRRLHHRVASVIESLRPDDLEALVYHYAQAGAQTCALTYSMRAAYRARQVYANEEAIRFYSQALDLMSDDHPGYFEVLAARAQVYGILAQHDEQQADVRAMLALAEELDDDARRCDALLALADFCLETEPLGAREPAERAATIAQALEDPVRQAHALRRLGSAAWYSNEWARSRNALQASVKLLRDANLPGEAAASLHTLSLTLSKLGDAPAAQEAAEQALTLSRQAGQRYHEATSLRRIAIVLMNAYQHAQALPFAQEALALHRELGDRSEECNALNVLGIIMSCLGRAGQAQEYLEQTLELAEAIGHNHGISTAVSNMVNMYFKQQGEYQAGLEFLQAQLHKAHLAGDEFLSWSIQEAKITLLNSLGQFAAALELAQTWFPRIKELGYKSCIQYLSHIGRLQAELGDYEQARRSLEQALEQATEAERVDKIAYSLVSRAFAALLEGGESNLRLGLERAERAVELLRGTYWVLSWADALEMAARLYLALGQAEDALACSTQAVSTDYAWLYPQRAFLFTHYRALRAAGHEDESDDYLRRAYQRVMLVASKTQDKALRESWLENVRVNREIVAEWAART